MVGRDQTREPPSLQIKVLIVGCLDNVDGGRGLGDIGKGAAVDEVGLFQAADNKTHRGRKAGWKLATAL